VSRRLPASEPRRRLLFAGGRAAPVNSFVFQGVVLLDCCFQFSSARWEITVTADNKPRLRTIQKSSKLDNVCYDIRGPVMARARQMEEEGHRIIKLNIGNPAPFGFEAPEEIVQDVIVQSAECVRLQRLQGAVCGAQAIMHETSAKGIPGCRSDDIFVGNGVSELIVMSMQALLEQWRRGAGAGTDYPLWTAAVSLGGASRAITLCDEGAGWLPGFGGHPCQDHAQHPRHRHHQPEQSDRRAVSDRTAAGNPGNRAQAPS